VTNTGVTRYQKLSSRHLDVLQTAQPSEQTVLLVTQTNQSKLRIPKRPVPGCFATGYLSMSRGGWCTSPSGLPTR
jgi:hypothetical protein